MKSGVLLVLAIAGTAAIALAYDEDEPAPVAAEPEPAAARAASPGDPALPPGHPPIGESAPAMAQPGLPAGHPPLEPAAPAGSEAGPVEPAAGGVTVQQIVARAAELEGKKVRVRARVMRSTPNVLGRTWLRVQDGSGEARANDHELVVTTSDAAAVGEVVTLEGVIVRDKDLGSGYRYDVLLEDAKRIAD